MQKRILSGLLAFVLLVSNMGINSYAAEWNQEISVTQDAEIEEETLENEIQDGFTQQKEENENQENENQENENQDVFANKESEIPENENQGMKEEEVNSVSINSVTEEVQMEAVAASMESGVITDYAQLEEALQKGGTYTISGSITTTEETSADQPLVVSQPVTLKGGAVTLRHGGILLGAELTLENTEITFLNSAYMGIFANGHNLTLKNLRISWDLADPLSIAAGKVSNNTAFAVSAGNGSKIVIDGVNFVSATGQKVKVYAGNVFDASPLTPGGEAQTVANAGTGLSSEIIVKNLSGAKAELYALGASYTGTLPGNANASIHEYDKIMPCELCSTSGDVTFQVESSSDVSLVDAATGTEGNQAVLNIVPKNAEEITFTVRNLGGLILDSKNLTDQEARICLEKNGDFGFDSNADVIIPEGMILDVSAMENEIKVHNFTGGGKLILGKEQCLNITGTVTGTTQVAAEKIYGANYENGGLVLNDFTYIQAANAAASSFKLMPPMGERMEFLYSNGNFKTPAAEHTVQIEKIKDIAVLQTTFRVEQENADEFDGLHITWEESAKYQQLADIPLEIRYGEQTGSLEKLQDENGYYTYKLVIEDHIYYIDFADTSMCISEALPKGTHKFTLKVPAEYVVSAAEKEVTFTLKVGKGEELPNNPSEEEKEEQLPENETEEKDNNVTNGGGDWGEITPEDRTERNFQSVNDVPKALWIAGIKDFAYNGELQEQSSMNVYYHTAKLEPGKDYTVIYADNVKAGTASVTITGIGNYDGSIVKYFMIKPLDMADAQVEDVVVTYKQKKVQKSTPKVTYVRNGEVITLKEGRDFTYSYPNTNPEAEDYNENAFKEVGIYQVTITGIGNYTGTKTFEETITNKKLLSSVRMVSIPNQEYTGSEITPQITLKDGFTTLTEGEDYTVEYRNNKASGTATVIMTATNESPYAGSKTATFKIQGTSLYLADMQGFEKTFVWTGSEIRQTGVTLSYTSGWGENKTTTALVEGTHYTVEYRNNDAVGTATVIFKGLASGGYTGSIKKTFKITGISMSSVTLSGWMERVEFAGKDAKQTEYQLSYTDNQGQKKILEENTDYIVSYQNAEKTGMAVVVFTGRNGYSGTLKKTYRVTSYDMAKEDTLVSIGDIGEQPYVKGGNMPKPVVTYGTGVHKMTLEEGVHYLVSYVNNKTVGEKAGENPPTVIITGIGGYTGSLSETFTIKRGSLTGKGMQITASDILYQNKSNICKPVIALYDSDGSKLTEGKDYQVTGYTYAEDVRGYETQEAGSYLRSKGSAVEPEDIIPVGTKILASIQGMGCYEGNATAEFRVVSASLEKATVTVKPQYFRGVPVEVALSDIVVTLNHQVLTEADYEIVGYENNTQVGTGQLTLRGTGNYGGEITVSFKIEAKSMNNVVSFDKNCENATGTMKTQVLSPGAKLPENSFVNKGYNFKGWTMDKEGNGTLYVDQDVFNVEDAYGEEITLYAQWEVIPYKITYVYNDVEHGTVEEDKFPNTYTVEDEITLSAPYEKEGYTFQGWFTDAKFTAVKQISKIAKGSTGDITLYAKWKISYVQTVQKPDASRCLNISAFGIVADDGVDDTAAINDAIWYANYYYTQCYNEQLTTYKNTNYADKLEEGKMKAQELGKTDETEITSYAKAYATKCIEEMAKEYADANARNIVYLPAGTYNINPSHGSNRGICLASNMNLIMDNDTILYVKKSGSTYAVIAGDDISNVKIQGGQIQGERYRHSGSGGEGGHGINLRACMNMEIDSVSIASNWGDGIYIGTKTLLRLDNKKVGCDSIKITNCEIYDNLRNNIGIVDGDNITIDHCMIYNAHGTLPQAGILSEPNTDSSDDRVNRNIIIKNTTIKAYNGYNNINYPCFATAQLSWIKVTTDNVLIENCIFNGYCANFSGTNVTLKNTTITGTKVGNYQ